MGLTRRMGAARLRDAGVPEDGLEEAAELSLSDGSIVYNPKFIMEAGSAGAVPPGVVT